MLRDPCLGSVRVQLFGYLCTLSSRPCTALVIFFSVLSPSVLDRGVVTHPEKGGINGGVIPEPEVGVQSREFYVSKDMTSIKIYLKRLNFIAF